MDISAINTIFNGFFIIFLLKNKIKILATLLRVAIQILNKEKEGIIEPNKINVDDGYTKEKQLYTTAKNVKKTKYIRYNTLFFFI